MRHFGTAWVRAHFASGRGVIEEGAKKKHFLSARVVECMSNFNAPVLAAIFIRFRRKYRDAQWADIFGSRQNMFCFAPSSIEEGNKRRKKTSFVRLSRGVHVQLQRVSSRGDLHPIPPKAPGRPTASPGLRCCQRNRMKITTGTDTLKLDMRLFFGSGQEAFLLSSTHLQ